MPEREFSIEEQPEKPPKWAGFIKKLIKKMKMDIVPNVADSDYGYTYTENMIKEAESDMSGNETILLEDFEQHDGSKVHVKYEKKWDLNFVKELTISTPDQKQQYDLLKLLPEGYIMLAEFPIRQGRDFMDPLSKVIVVSSSFMSNLGSRLAALHEIGHAIDLTDNPEAFVRIFKNEDEKLKCEERAYDNMERLLEKLEEKGIQYVPKEFDKIHFNNVKEFALNTYKKDPQEHVVGQEKDIKE